MENNELKKVCIKIRTRYYFDDKVEIEDFDFDIIWLDGESYENNLIFDISYNTLIDAKPFRIMLDDVDGLIRYYDETKYLALFDLENDDSFYDRIRYLIRLESGMTYLFLIIKQKSKLIDMIIYL